MTRASNSAAPGVEQPSRAPSERELRRLYERCIRPDLLGNMQASERPVAMLISGQPGAGITFASVQLRHQLAQTVPTVAHLSVNRVRAYHPWWSHGKDLKAEEAARVLSDCQTWFNRLTQDAQKQHVNLLAEVKTTAIDAVPALASDLRRNGYVVQAVFVATSREESRQALMARYDMRRRAGLGAEPPSAQAHDLALRSIANVLGRLEYEKLVDGLRVITAHGHQLYESRIADGVLNRLPRAAETLTSQLEKPPANKDLVRFAMRWETLVQRLVNEPSVPRDIASQVLAWRNDAVTRCEREPAAAQALQWAREAGAFRVMNRKDFLNEFPHHERAAHTLTLAQQESERHPAGQAARLVAHARENIAQRIERGDMAKIAARQKSNAIKRQAEKLRPVEDGPAQPSREQDPLTR